MDESSAIWSTAFPQLLAGLQIGQMTPSQSVDPFLEVADPGRGEVAQFLDARTEVDDHAVGRRDPILSLFRSRSTRSSAVLIASARSPELDRSFSIRSRRSKTFKRLMMAFTLLLLPLAVVKT
jgi:hypothetical protein